MFKFHCIVKSPTFSAWLSCGKAFYWLCQNTSVRALSWHQPPILDASSGSFTVDSRSVYLLSVITALFTSSHHQWWSPLAIKCTRDEASFQITDDILSIWTSLSLNHVRGVLSFYFVTLCHIKSISLLSGFYTQTYWVVSVSNFLIKTLFGCTANRYTGCYSGEFLTKGQQFAVLLNHSCCSHCKHGWRRGSESQNLMNYNFKKKLLMISQMMSDIKGSVSTKWAPLRLSLLTLSSWFAPHWVDVFCLSNGYLTV